MSKHYLVTGGAGFIGTNYTSRLLDEGKKVTIYDNLSRAGASYNIKWLRSTYGNESFVLVEGDMRDFPLLKSTARSEMS